MIARRSTSADLDRILSWQIIEPVSQVTAESYRADLAERRHRPEWTWLIEEDGRTLARGVWWGRSDSDQPLALDCLSVEASVTDPVSVAAELLDAGHRAFEIRPTFQIKVANDWQDDPAAAAAVAWRREAARRAGLSYEVQRLQFEWAPDAGVPAKSERLIFTPEPDDEVFLEVFRHIAHGSLDAETRRNLAANGAEQTAREELNFYLAAPGDRGWWRLAHTVDGKLAGMAIPSATPYGPNVGYLGVLPEMRGNGLINDILAEIVRLHSERAATRITATTDTANQPMAAAFIRAGFRNTEVRLVFDAP